MRFCNGKFKTDEDGEFLLDKRGVPMLDVFGSKTYFWIVQNFTGKL